MMMPESFLLLLHLHTTTFGIYTIMMMMGIYEFRFSSFFREAGSCVVYMWSEKCWLIFWLFSNMWARSRRCKIDEGTQNSLTHVCICTLHFHQHSTSSSDKTFKMKLKSSFTGFCLLYFRINMMSGNHSNKKWSLFWFTEGWFMWIFHFIYSIYSKHTSENLKTSFTKVFCPWATRYYCVM